MSGWLIALIAVGGLLLLLLVLLFCGVARLRIRCRDGVQVFAGVLGLRFRLYPQKEPDTTPRGFCRSPNRVLAREMRRLKREAKRAEKKQRKKTGKESAKGKPAQAESAGESDDDPSADKGFLPDLQGQDPHPDPADADCGCNRRCRQDRPALG